MIYMSGCNSSAVTEEGGSSFSDLLSNNISVIKRSMIFFRPGLLNKIIGLIDRIDIMRLEVRKKDPSIPFDLLGSLSSNLLGDLHIARTSLEDISLSISGRDKKGKIKFENGSDYQFGFTKFPEFLLNLILLDELFGKKAQNAYYDDIALITAISGIMGAAMQEPSGSTPGSSFLTGHTHLGCIVVDNESHESTSPLLLFGSRSKWTEFFSRKSIIWDFDHYLNHAFAYPLFVHLFLIDEYLKDLRLRRVDSLFNIPFSEKKLGMNSRYFAFFSNLIQNLLDPNSGLPVKYGVELNRYPLAKGLSLILSPDFLSWFNSGGVFFSSQDIRKYYLEYKKEYDIESLFDVFLSSQPLFCPLAQVVVPTSRADYLSIMRRVTIRSLIGMSAVVSQDVTSPSFYLMEKLVATTIPSSDMWFIDFVLTPLLVESFINPVRVVSNVNLYVRRPSSYVNVIDYLS